MKTSTGYKIWQIVYPIGIYYVVSSLAYFVLTLFLGEDTQTYMVRQMFCSAVTIPVIQSFYMQDKHTEEIVYGKRTFSVNPWFLWMAGIAAVGMALLGFAVNNLIAMTGLVGVSAGFERANTAFFGGTVLYELLGSCLLIPVAEELIFRGVVFKRLKLYIGAVPAMVLSALIFGIMHVNLVQCLYAAVLGFGLALLYEKTNLFCIPVIGHIAANLVAVARAETGIFDFAFYSSVSGIVVTFVAAACAGVLLYRVWKMPVWEDMQYKQ